MKTTFKSTLAALGFAILAFTFCGCESTNGNSAERHKTHNMGNIKSPSTMRDQDMSSRR